MATATLADRAFFFFTGPRAERHAWCVWGVLLAVVAAMVWARPDHRSANPIYEKGTARLLAHAPLYDTRIFDGYVYPPGFAAVYYPIHAMPDGPGGAMWRVLMLATLASGVWRACRLIAPPPAPPVFLIVTLLLLPASVSAARNGQVNVFLSGAFLHGAVEFGRGRWWRCGAWLGLAAALKPIAVVPLLLAGAVQPLVLPAAALVALAICATPLLFAPLEYVLEQHRVFADILLRRGGDTMAVPSLNTAELRGALFKFGVEAPPALWTALRAVLAFLTLALWWFVARRRRAPADRAAWLPALAATYLMLCNPANETNSYVILAPAMALWGVLHWQRPASRRAGIAAALFCLGYLAPSLGIYKLLHLWWYVLLAIAFAIVMTLEARRSPAP